MSVAVDSKLMISVSILLEIPSMVMLSAVVIFPSASVANWIL